MHDIRTYARKVHLSRTKSSQVWALALAAIAGFAISSMCAAERVVADEIRRWDTCADLTWKIDATGNSAATQRTMRRAVRQFVVASGLKFRFAGIAGAGEFDAPPRNTLVLGVRGDLVGTGIAGLTSVSYVSEEGAGKLISGVRVAINPQVAQRSVSGLPDLMPVLLHELGHVAGLDHVDDKADLMYPYIVNVSRYRPRDVAKMRAVSQMMACPGAGLPGR
jgi:hypothetical protein